MDGPSRRAPNATSSFQPKVAPAMKTESGVHPAVTPHHQMLIPKTQTDGTQRTTYGAVQRCHRPREELGALGTALSQPNADFQQYLTHSVKMSPSQGPDRRDRTFKLLQDKLEEKTLQ